MSNPLFVCLFSLFLSALLRAQSTPATPPGADSPPYLTFNDAVARVLDADPRVSLLRARLEEAAGLAEQAALRPNPALEAEVENILGTGPFDGLDAAETTVIYAQELETGGQRRLRTAV